MIDANHEQIEIKRAEAKHKREDTKMEMLERTQVLEIERSKAVVELLEKLHSLGIDAYAEKDEDGTLKVAFSKKVD